jgi:hypothetical protein
MTASLRIILIVPVILIASLFLTPRIYAASGVTQFCQSATAQRTTFCQDTSKGNSDANKNNNPVISVIKTAITILSYIIGVASVVTIIISGLRMVLSEGKPENISSARSAIIFAVVGVIIAISAQLIVVFVLDKLG